MKLFAENGYYEVVYDNKYYENLEFIRLDTICNKTYVTLRNVVTREMYTFDHNQIKKIRKKMFRLPSFKHRRDNVVAEEKEYSL
ncbi:hypothetical protein SM124_22735 [Bacillus sp. 31A1R]|uniref:Uncharacterized protein n=1 Tax=Robertmurraya mangrovi TaxID=3098077 RepID=A0ABU5J593_9BACI|nr:hypothetical protein [Bacillus sp. 31A1R]MDZ5474496.1 hypothetical protein [Bacillus sp. 31A1R]